MRADTRTTHSQRTGPRATPDGGAETKTPAARRTGGHGASIPKLRTTGLPQLNVDDSEARMEWISRALCRDIDPDELFVRGAAQRKAASICKRCPVVYECAADALDNRVEFGVWGGMTERQRRALLKQHPDVPSWAEFFEAHRRRGQVG